MFELFKKEEERSKRQNGIIREFLIGTYAPLEPIVMESISKFLEIERKFPIPFIKPILDRLAGISVSTTVASYIEIVEFIKQLPDEWVISRGPCACRLYTAKTAGYDGRDLSSKKFEFCCDSPSNIDIQIATAGEKFGELKSYSFITKEELLDLEAKCFNAGLVMNIYQMWGGETGICNCSSVTCVPLMANEALGYKSTVLKKGRLIAKTDREKCEGTGDCVKVCHFNARSLKSHKGKLYSTTDLSLCYGCGLCSSVCPNNAIDMIPRH